MVLSPDGSQRRHGQADCLHARPHKTQSSLLNGPNPNPTSMSALRSLLFSHSARSMSYKQAWVRGR